MGSTAILLATVPDDRGASAAALPYRGSLLGHLVDQLADLDIDAVTVITRPRWRPQCVAALAAAAIPVSIRDSSDLAGDLELMAAAAAGGWGRLLLAPADLAVSRDALAGLLKDPRVATGALVMTASPPGWWTAPVRIARGRIVSAGSAFHLAGRPNAALPGVLMVAADHTAELAGAATQLARLARPPLPPSWRTQQGAAGELGVLGQDRPGRDVPGAVRQAREDVVALLTVGLVRAGVPMAALHVRGFFLTRPTSPEQARQAESAGAAVAEDRVLLDAAVKSNDGAFTTFLVSPYSRYLARAAARAGWTPNGVTTLSLGIGVLAAGSFAFGNRPGLVLGGVLLQAAFTADCVDGQLARYTRSFSGLGGWLDSVFDRAKEYAVYAGLAVGSLRGFGDDVWLLAAAALALQTVRHTVDSGYVVAQHLVIGQATHPPLCEAADTLVAVDGEPFPEAASAAAPGALTPGAPAPGQRRAAAGRGAIAASRALERRSWMRYGKKILVLPIGERFALISLTAAFFSPRTTFVALLTWGSAAAGYGLSGKMLRSVAS